MTVLQYLLPAPAQLAGLLALFLVAAGLVAIGGLAAGRRRRPEGDLVYGWAVIVSVFTLAGAAGIGRFTALAALLALAAAAAAYFCVRRDGRFGPPGAARVLILSLPLVALVAAMGVTQWDELTHWLPNARYLFEHDSVPLARLPASPSAMPAYPYGLPLILFMASRLTGFLVENAGAIFNLLLYLSFGLLVTRIVAATVTANPPAGAGGFPRSLDGVRLGWGLSALAALTVTILNPTFVTRLVFSSYADAGTAITVGFACGLAWLALEALAGKDDAAAKSYSWQAGLAATAMIGLKQVNLVLVVALFFAFVLIALRDPAIDWRRALRLTPRIVALPFAVYLVWRFHVAFNISGGEFSVRPYDTWLVQEIPDIVARMALVASKKGGYFGIMTVAVVLGLRGFLLPRTAFDRLAMLTGAMFVAYNLFLLFTYVSAFGNVDGLRAASYWRYNTHLGGLCLLFAAFAIALLWRRFVRRKAPAALAAFAMVLVVALPVAMGQKLRFDKHPRYGYARTIAADIAATLTQDDRLLLVDPEDDGQYLVIMRYRMHGSARVVAEINAWSRPTAQLIRDSAASRRASHVWVYSAHPAVSGAFGLALAPNSSYLLARDGSRWRIVRAWPHGAPGG